MDQPEVNSHHTMLHCDSSQTNLITMCLWSSTYMDDIN